MADENETDDAGPAWRIKAWQGRLIAVLLVVAGAVHAFKPAWLTLDWPSIALILVGVLLLFVPLEDVGSVIESLEFGKTKILFRKVKQLDASVEKAIREDAAATSDAEKVKSLGMSPAPSPERAMDSSSPPELPVSPGGKGTGEMGRTPLDPRNEWLIQSLLATDKEMALIRIGVEIERTLIELERQSGIATRSVGMNWSKIVNALVQVERISPQTAHALYEFRSVRNQLVHPSAGKVPESLVISAVDSGLKLLRLLSATLETARR